MRDAHRMKEKLELSLDNRQVVSVLIGGIVVLGAVFVLGVVVGKKLAGTGSVQNAPDILTALDQQAQAMDEVRADPQLTFQEELTRKVTVETPRPDAPPVKVVTVAAPPAPEPVKVEDPAPAPSKDALLAAAPPPATPAAVKQTVDAQVEAAPVTARTSPKESDLQKAIARTAVKPTVIEGGGFTLQLSATQTRAEADKFVAKLRTQGYAPYIVEAEVPGKGTWYRVRMGRFPTKDAAGRYLQDFRRETRLDAFVAAAN